MSDARIVFCTCPDLESAENIATALVQARLAACANVVPGLSSIFRWQEQIQRANEVLLVIKTRAELFEALTEVIHGSHPYDMPEVIALPIAEGETAYLDWLTENTRPESDG